jgi:hypothetical protein
MSIRNPQSAIPAPLGYNVEECRLLGLDLTEAGLDVLDAVESAFAFAPAPLLLHLQDGDA